MLLRSSLIYFLRSFLYMYYRKFPKYLETPKICCNHPKSWTRWHFFRVMHPKDAEGIANSVDPDQTAPIWICTVCQDLSVQKLRKIMVIPDFAPPFLALRSKEMNTPQPLYKTIVGGPSQFSGYLSNLCYIESKMHRLYRKRSLK